MKKRFSIVIVHRNGAEMLLNTLSALVRAWDETRDEVFLVDNGSSDDSAERVAAAFPETIIIRNRCNNGFARANNQAIARASGEFILLLNSDAVLAADVLDRFEADFRRESRVGAITGQLLDAAGGRQRSGGSLPTALNELGLGFLKKKPVQVEHNGLVETETVVGACMAVRMAVIQEAGSLDNDFFFYGEDIEWCYRIRRYGWLVVIDPAARITHIKGAATRGKRRGAQVEMLRARFQFYRKTMSPPVALFVSVFRVLRVVINTVVNLAATVLTLGLHARIREKAIIYLMQLAWLALGRPENWGLPDKCPRERDPVMKGKA
ncbi:MAG TPA: glycosyltransferase family 2 protein [Acidiferrobacterales bacterium]|nr:glycosyltransferase family 2 protein [Acidiferrobacterales bacterium]